MGYAGKRGSSYKSKAKGKAEDVKIKVCTDQRICNKISYGTPRAEEMRDLMYNKILFNGERVFYFHDDGEKHEFSKVWSNVDPESTLDEPKVTSPPLEALERAYTAFTKSSAVGKITIVDEDHNEISYEQAKQIKFKELEDVAIDDNASESGSVDSIAEALTEVKEDVTAFKEDVYVKCENLQNLVADLAATNEKMSNRVDVLEDVVYKLSSQLDSSYPAAEPEEEYEEEREEKVEDLTGESETEAVTPEPTTKKRSRLQKAAEKAEKKKKAAASKAPEPPPADEEEDEEPIVPKGKSARTKSASRRL